MASLTHWGTIDGREITFPMTVDSFNGATLGFTVPLDAATNLLPGEAFEVIETAPSMAQFIISICDYRENPWGDYNEFNLGFLARPAGASADVVGSFIYRMPVDQEFTCEAGNKVMGFPKVVTRIDAEYTDDRVSFQLWDQGEVALGVALPRVPNGAINQVESTSYSYLDGVAFATSLAMEMSSSATDAADVELTIGSGPIADELRSLGLPTVPDFCMWGEGLSATFQMGERV